MLQPQERPVKIHPTILSFTAIVALGTAALSPTPASALAGNGFGKSGSSMPRTTSASHSTAPSQHAMTSHSANVTKPTNGGRNLNISKISNSAWNRNLGRGSVVGKVAGAGPVTGKASDPGRLTPGISQFPNLPTPGKGNDPNKISTVDGLPGFIGDPPIYKGGCEGIAARVGCNPTTPGNPNNQPPIRISTPNNPPVPGIPLIPKNPPPTNCGDHCNPPPNNCITDCGPPPVPCITDCGPPPVVCIDRCGTPPITIIEPPRHDWWWWWYAQYGEYPIFVEPVVGAEILEPVLAPCNCLVKEYRPDGTSFVKDLCTKEVFVYLPPPTAMVQVPGPATP
jgi:hypothetical protein